MLLSDHFYYFGSKPVPLPTHLLPIIQQRQGHKSTSNDPYVEKFVAWLAGFKRQKNKVNAAPLGLDLYIEENFKNKCSKVDLEEDHADENIQD